MIPDNPTCLIPFNGKEEWEWFEKYCKKINRKPVDLVAEFIKEFADKVKDEETKNSLGIKGKLTTYHDMGTEGPVPAFFPLGTSNLSDMIMVGWEDYVTVFNPDGTIVAQGVLGDEELMGYCKESLFAKLERRGP